MDTTRRAAQRATLRRDQGKPIVPTGSVAQPRLAGFDALRSAAMFLVVIAHAAMAYTAVDVPGLLWAVRDSHRSLAFDALFLTCISIAMPLFFTLGGFFAVRLFDDRGPERFAQDRARRILGPFIVGGATILPASLVAWGLGWILTGRATWSELFWMSFADEHISRYLFGPAHLWFLEHLILMLTLYWVFRRWRPDALTDATPRAASVRGGLLHPLAPFALAVPTALILGLGHLRIGLDAITDSRNSFIPDLFRWAHHAWFFAVGTWLYRHRDNLDRLTAHWGWRLALCVPILAIRCRLVAEDFVAPLHAPASVLLAVSGALFGWLSLFGLLGLARRVFARPRASIRYLADASYWIYLAHFPIVGLVQVNVWGLPIASGWKFATVTTLTMVLGLASYQVLVRRTWIGRWLHGPRPLLAPAPGSPTAAPACPAPTVGLR